MNLETPPPPPGMDMVSLLRPSTVTIMVPSIQPMTPLPFDRGFLYHLKLASFTGQAAPQGQLLTFNVNTEDVILHI